MFYQANLRLLSVLFVVGSLLAIALGMGVPLGNLLLGILAGFYVGRRHVYAGRESQVFLQASRRVGKFTGTVVALIALPVGLLALFAGEEGTARVLVEAVGISYSTVAGLGLVVVLCGVLWLMQYALARGAAWVAYHGWTLPPAEMETETEK